MRISDWSSDVCSSDLWSVLVIKCLPGGIVLRGPAITASEKATNRSRFGALIQYSPFARCHRSAMMPEATPKPVPAAPHRTTPCAGLFGWHVPKDRTGSERSEEHTSELKSLMRLAYAVFCLKKKRKPR